MTRFLTPMLTVPVLETLGGQYEGVIAVVREEMIRNRFKGQKYAEAVITFHDGKQMVLNKTMLRTCIGWFGAESANWVGRRIWVFVRRAEKLNPETGETRLQLQRGIACEDPHTRVREPQRRASAHVAREREPGEDDDAPSHPEVTLDVDEIFRRCDLEEGLQR